MTTLLTSRQVAALFGVQPVAVHQWVKSGRLPVASRGPGRTGWLRFDPAVVERFLAHAP